MTYQEIKDRLSKCELTLQMLKNGSSTLSNKEVQEKTAKLEVLKESLQKQLNEKSNLTAFIDGRAVDIPPLGAEDVSRCKPQFITMDGWNGTTFRVKKWEELPTEAQNYLQKIEDLTGIPIHIVSTGPERDETILIEHPFEIN